MLSGVSAGSICWHVGGPTDSFGPVLRPVTDGLGLLPYGNGVHYDKEEQRRPLLHTLVGGRDAPPVVRHRRHHRRPLRGHRAGRRPHRRHEGHRRLRRGRPATARRRTSSSATRPAPSSRPGCPLGPITGRAHGHRLGRELDHRTRPGGLAARPRYLRSASTASAGSTGTAPSPRTARRDRRVEQVPPARLGRHRRDVVAARQPPPRRLAGPAVRPTGSRPGLAQHVLLAVERADHVRPARCRARAAAARAHRRGRRPTGATAPRSRGSSATNTSSSAPPRRASTSA